MDSIDITDSAFSLGIPNFNEVISSEGSSSFGDYTTFMYFGAIVLIVFVGMFVYKYYQNKNVMKFNDDVEDCSGGFCTMNQKTI